MACDGLSNGHRHIAAAPQAVNEGMGYDFSGYKQLMGYAAGQITEVGCWTHSRRKFHDMHKASQSQMAECAFHAIARRQLS